MPRIGQRIRLYNDRHWGTIYAIHAFGTVDAEDDNGNCFRVTGLPFLGDQ